MLAIFKKIKGAFIFSLVPLIYFCIFCFSSKAVTKNALELIFNIHMLTAIGFFSCLLVTVIFSGLTGKIKRSFLQQLSMALLGIFVIVLVIYPIISLYDQSIYLGTITCLVACFAYCKLILYLTSSWMTRLAQQEN